MHCLTLCFSFVFLRVCFKFHITTFSPTAPLLLQCGTTILQTPWTPRILPSHHLLYLSTLPMPTVLLMGPQGPTGGRTAQTCPHYCWGMVAWRRACWRQWRGLVVLTCSERRALLHCCLRKEGEVKGESLAPAPLHWVDILALVVEAVWASLSHLPWPLTP